MQLLLQQSSVVCLVCHNREPGKNGWTDWDTTWDVNSGGLEELCIRSPTRKGHAWKGWRRDFPALCWALFPVALTSSSLQAVNQHSDWPATEQQHNNCFTALCPGLHGWAGTRWNTHPPTYHDRHPIFISFFHLPQSIASSLFNIRAWQSFCSTSLRILFGLPLGLEPSTSYSIHFFTQSVSQWRVKNYRRCITLPTWEVHCQERPI